MEKRIIFENGRQREFLDLVLKNLGSSLRNLLAYDPSLSYPLLKKYYEEKCSIPKPLFIELCRLSGVKINSLEYSESSGNWGQVIGGKNGIGEMRRKYGAKMKEWRKNGGKNRWKARR
jgi:hypothetical protein